jgi:hypothetical protein
MDFHLEDHEYLTEISGRCGLAIDALKFKTNMGRESK